MKKYLMSFVIGVALLSGAVAYAANNSTHPIFSVSKQSHPFENSINISSVMRPQECEYSSEDFCLKDCAFWAVLYNHEFYKCETCGKDKKSYYCEVSD